MASRVIWIRKLANITSAMTKDDETIALLRSQFEKELHQNPDQFHAVDIDRVRTDDWTISRYLLSHSCPNKAYEALTKSLRWKKSFGVHDRKDADFPREWWEMSSAEICGRDNDGRLINWGSSRRLYKFNHPKARLMTEQYIVHILERLDSMAGEAGKLGP